MSRPAMASTYAYVNPLVAVLLGWLVLAEEVNPRIWVAGGHADPLNSEVWSLFIPEGAFDRASNLEI